MAWNGEVAGGERKSATAVWRESDIKQKRRGKGIGGDRLRRPGLSRGKWEGEKSADQGRKRRQGFGRN